jgi:hypothetical protein
LEGGPDPLAAPLLRKAARAIALALTFAFALALVSGSGAETASGRLGGDHPAFYAAGRLVTSDRRADMYDSAVQAEMQEGLFPANDNEGLLYFAYPPHTALAYAPLSHLPYRASYAIHTLLMVAAVAAALHLVRPMVAVVDRNFELVTIATVAFYPMYRAITGGQNTALTLLLLAASWRAVATRHDALAGALLGLLLYKPQFALPLIGLHLLARRWRVGVGAGVTALGCWAIGALLLGPRWLGSWLDSVRAFSDLDAHVNKRNAVSFLGVADTVFGVGDGAGRTIGGLLALATVVVLIVVWRGRPRDRLGAAMLVALPAIVLISPHAMFYDSGLLVLPLAVMMAATNRTIRIAAAALWCAGFLDVAKEAVGLTPVFAVTVAVFAGALHCARNEQTDAEVWA